MPSRDEANSSSVNDSVDVQPNAQSSPVELSNDLQASLAHSITIIFWYQPNEDPVRLHITIPTFPLFQFSKIPSLASDLGLTAASYMDTYNPNTSQWEQHTINSVRVVQAQQRLLYRVRRTLLQAVKSDECPGIADELQLQLQHTVHHESVKRARDTNHEGARTANAKRQRADNTMALSVEPDHHYPSQDPTTMTILQYSGSGSTSSHALSCEQQKHDSVSSPPDSPLATNAKRWPNDYTVASLTAGFTALDALIARSPGMLQKTAFERVFSSRYVKSTVCRHRSVWRKAPTAVKGEFLALGEDIERASWGEFVRRVEGRNTRDIRTTTQLVNTSTSSETHSPTGKNAFAGTDETSLTQPAMSIDESPVAALSHSNVYDPSFQAPEQLIPRHISH